MSTGSQVLDRVPESTLAWLLAPDNPAVSVLTRRRLLREPDASDAQALWARRNEYPPVAAIIDAMRSDGTWDVPARDYQKYRGNLWQIHLLGELWADGGDPRLQPALDYALSRQLDDGSWSATNKRPYGSITCLTANVGRALARLGYAEDERVIAALRYCVDLYRELGAVDCRRLCDYHLNGYCHMLTPKILLFLAEVPHDLWPKGAETLRAECIAQLRDKAIFRSLPVEAREFEMRIGAVPPAERAGFRTRFLAEHPALQYGEKPGWLRFGYPLSYNSDALEALAALAATGEKPRHAYEDAIALVEASADDEMRWKLRTTLNGKMFGNVEKKGQPSKWLTLRALRVLNWAG
ncbi:MAG: hypothetical protein HY876_05535 [Coriobacteriales bacterium]|nr:hypothetical protein [Coriobacteriales bacterium]